jgi:hypothetical protein
MEAMHTPQQKLNRRSFLKLAAAAGIATAGGYVLFETAPWLNYDDQTQQTRRPFASEASGSAQLREMIRYAALAANGHNTQPWKFAIKENAIEIHPDYARRLPIVDPDDRELWISLGCALENLLVAARASGYAPEVVYPDAQEFIQVRLTADTAQSSRLFDAVPLRQTTRSEYNGQPVETVSFDQLVALPREPGVSLHFVTNPADMERVVEYVHMGNVSQYADKAFVEELIAWLRFSKKEALASLDGLFMGSTGNPEVPRWIGQMFVAGTDPQQQADGDTRKLRSSPHALVIASEAEDKPTWVRTGQVYERMALTMTSLGIHSAFLNQPVEVADVRAQFQSAMGLSALLPQLLVRFGYGTPMPKSLRRPVENIVI